MTTLTTPLGYLIISTALFSAGCATTAPPSELVFARAAYLHVHTGQAQQLAPEEVRMAGRALAVAEQSFKDEPRSFVTRDLAYFAGQKAHHAEVLAIAAASTATTASPEVPRARILTDEASTIVATFPASALFAPDQSELLPAASDRLDQVAAALMVAKERRLTVEGHSDSQGSTVFNRVLSQQRANVVRSYIISRGYSGILILVSGVGDASPVASNASPEGRANNRRIDIIVDPPVRR